MSEPNENLDKKVTNTETQRPSMNIHHLDLLFHPVKKTQDGRCEYISWMGEDLIHCPGIGEWKCLLRKYSFISDQYGMKSGDFLECNCRNHLNCKYYLNLQSAQNAEGNKAE